MSHKSTVILILALTLSAINACRVAVAAPILERVRHFAPVPHCIEWQLLSARLLNSQAKAASACQEGHTLRSAAFTGSLQSSKCLTRSRAESCLIYHRRPCPRT